jgi:hypothetical protein
LGGAAVDGVVGVALLLLSTMDPVAVVSTTKVRPLPPPTPPVRRPRFLAIESCCSRVRLVVLVVVVVVVVVESVGIVPPPVDDDDFVVTTTAPGVTATAPGIVVVVADEVVVGLIDVVPTLARFFVIRSCSSRSTDRAEDDETYEGEEVPAGVKGTTLSFTDGEGSEGGGTSGSGSDRVVIAEASTAADAWSGMTDTAPGRVVVVVVVMAPIPREARFLAIISCSRWDRPVVGRVPAVTTAERGLSVGSTSATASAPGWTETATAPGRDDDVSVSGPSTPVTATAPGFTDCAPGRVVLVLETPVPVRRARALI